MPNKMRIARLRWLGYVQRRSVDAPVRRCNKLYLRVIQRGKDRPKKYYKEVIKSSISLRT